MLKYGLTKPFTFRDYRIPLKNRLILGKNTINDSKSGLSTKSQSIKSMFLTIYKKWFLVAIMAINLFYVLPIVAEANWVGDRLNDVKNVVINIIGNSESLPVQKIETINVGENSQNIQLPTATTNLNSSGATGGGEPSFSGDGEALVSVSGPSGTQADISDTVSTGQISKYVVRKGDSLASIAKMYGVTTNTIIWANNVTASSIKEGQSLIILPVSGTLHTVVKGDTLKSIAKKYKADVGEISQFNGLDSSFSLAIGDTIVIPDGEGTAKVSGTVKPASKSNPYRGGSGPDYAGYYIRPLIGGVKTQSLHGYNAVDIGIPVGTMLRAAAAGQVIVVRSSGWNGGYGKYVVISHYNGTQTVYGHMSQVNVNEGDTVYQGQMIGLSGNTGNSTGPHLHFEVRGAKNFMNN